MYFDLVIMGDHSLPSGPSCLFCTAISLSFDIDTRTDCALCFLACIL